MGKKQCVVYNCTNEDVLIAGICTSCYNFILTGGSCDTSSFLGDMKRKIKTLEEKVDQLTPRFRTRILK